MPRKISCIEHIAESEIHTGHSLHRCYIRRRSTTPACHGHATQASHVVLHTIIVIIFEIARKTEIMNIDHADVSKRISFCTYYESYVFCAGTPT